MAPQQKARTRKRRLHLDTPFWAATKGISVPMIAAPSSKSWDVIIMGSGISGALMAEALSRQKGRILLLDRRPPARGSTLASTAMIQHEIDVPLHRLARRIGPEKAARAWRRSVKAVHALEKLVARCGIECDMQPKSALYLTGDEMGHRAMHTEFLARQEAGIASEYLDHAELLRRYGIDRMAALLSRASASANPARLTAGLLRLAAERGVEIASPVEVTDLAEGADSVALATSDGTILTAGQAIFCTGYEFLPQMESKAHRITSTWALASQPRMARPDWLDGMLVWEAADPYLYFRTAKDGRIIAGGEDRDDALAYKDPALLRASTERIIGKLHALCGIEIGAPAYVWAAPFGNTTDGLPIIDRVPGLSRCHAVMGFGGNGITFSMIAAEIVAARLAGHVDADEDLFAFR
ncbi:MAG TPA: FAD-dependent oxidoreductase [Paracoccus sp. (in: a-proteobacteria)]|uniref:NAD(P)/FAD-dependent oxidoreductase n=1 Tax=Paracoccus sp. TaxID=267 RepID=UPI002C8D07EA|nr:FAD-dependent oxidoreductase [Paracoccus sp. (in: a-proteobacteria)]HWL57613.1 FAD-dependent oxidoreductase [Paracoccus sp. (in: a-proteobacteria)]